MSLSEPAFLDIVKQQYRYKFKSLYSVFGSLLIMQLLGILFSMGNIAMSGFGSGMYDFTTMYYSGDVVIALTILWGFVTGVYLTTKAIRYEDFSFVASRYSSSTANALFLAAGSGIAGVIASLSTYIVKVAIYFTHAEVLLGSGSSLVDAPLQFLTGMVATVLYILFFSALGYLVGMFVQISRLFIFILPLLFTIAIVGGVISGFEEAVKAVNGFLFTESNLLFFFLKVVVLSCLLFAGAAKISNRMEVRR